jgi:hypothetical protein
MAQLVTAFILLLGGLPEPQSIAQAARQLLVKDGERQLEALKNLKSVCRGPQRHGFRDAGPIEKALKRLAAKADPKRRAEVLAAVMDTSPCFSAPRFAPLVKAQLADTDPAVVAYAAETAGQLNQPEMLALLIEQLRNWRKRCSVEGLSAERVKVCVWLAYAPGAVLPNVKDTSRRSEVLSLVLPLLDSAYPKVREVSVETVAATELKTAIEPLVLLIAKEGKKGGFRTPNDPALVGRFEQRLQALKKRHR